MNEGVTSNTHLPPGQIETKRFPAVGERVPSADLSVPSRWEMAINGLVDTPSVITLDQFLSGADQILTFDIHCVTGWTRFDSSFSGVPLALLLEEASVQKDARFVSFDSYSERGHHVSLPLEVAMDSSWLVHSFEGDPLTVEHGGPVRVVTPGRYFYKSIKWLKTISLLAEDRPGWWEVDSSYHNNADPWPGDQRFTTGSLRPDQLERFLNAPTYDKYRNRVFLGLDLRGWQPATLDLRRLYLKNCDLRDVDFRGADFRESNLSLSNLVGANLSGANFSGSDLEGADFAGADLSKADLTDTALSATRFGGALVSGADFSRSRGLVEEQEAYLVGQGIRLTTDAGSS